MQIIHSTPMTPPCIMHKHPGLLFALFALCITLLAPAGFSFPHRAGANHHLGDDSFIARHGRAPTPADSEVSRMRVHLQYVRELLGSRHATAPEREARRAQLLGYLDDYIAKGVTPVNTYVPWRNPVFIDARGNVCAVGYLIERSVGRALAERIAATHRLDYLEDIAAAMPEVAAWAASSGFTLQELASIQPGYVGPDVMHLAGWLSGKPDGNTRIGRTRPADGPYRDDDGFEGRFVRGQMEGEWRQTLNGTVMGKGVFHLGTGHWKSMRADGSLLAEGLAATGTMSAGRRDGAWRFYHDAPGMPVLAEGRFVRGEARGPWKHYTTSGVLLATTMGREGEGFTLSAEPARDGVRRVVRQGMPADSFRLDGFSLGGHRLYVTNEGDMIDADGNFLERQDGKWLLHACRRSSAYKTAARMGNVKALFHLMHGVGRDDGKKPDCDPAVIAVAPSRAQHYERMLTSRDQMHTPIPEFNVDPAWEKARAARASGEEWQTAPEDRPATGHPNDMVTHLANHMAWYIEFPHVDGTFSRVYASLPGYQRQPE
jgi:hypothetical protein